MERNGPDRNPAADPASAERDALAETLKKTYDDGAANGWDAVEARIRAADADARRPTEPRRTTAPRRLALRRPWPVLAASLAVVLASSSLLLAALNGAFFTKYPSGAPTATPPVTPRPTAVPTVDLRDQEKYITVKVDPVLPLAASSNALSAEYIASLRRLGARVLAEMARSQTGKNLMLSPVSLSMCLSMLLPGAVGETRDEMQAALGYGTMDLDDILAQNRAAFQNLFRDDGPLQVRIANSAWCLKDFPFEPAFLDAAKGDFFASIRAIDWSAGADPLKLINAWVSERTNGRIPRLVGSLDPQTVLVLLNAVSFLGEWEKPFETKWIRKAPFTRADGTVVQADMMSGFDNYRVQVAEDGTVSVALTYKEGMAMVLALPPKGAAVGAPSEALLEAMAGWKDWPETGFAIQVPKFTFTNDIPLIPILQALGMERAFVAGEADFSGVSPEADGLCISDAIQKTFIAVTEKGTEAEAATAVVLSGGHVEPAVFDRPFWFAILDEQGVPLFAGTVNDPTSEQGCK